MGLPLDTTLDARRRELDAYRAMSSEERLRLADQISDDVRALTRAGIRARHPGDVSEDEVDAALARILVGANIETPPIALDPSAMTRTGPDPARAHSRR